MNSKKLYQEPAFPFSENHGGKRATYPGMDKRFYAACVALQGLIIRNGIGSFPSTKLKNVEILVEDAYMIANKLLENESGVRE